MERCGQGRACRSAGGRAGCWGVTQDVCCSVIGVGTKQLLSP